MTEQNTTNNKIKLKIRTNKDNKGNPLTYTILNHPTMEFEFNTYYKALQFKKDYEVLRE